MNNMNYIKKMYYKFFCVMQWGIGLSYFDINEFFAKKKNYLEYKWIPILENCTSIADPFIFRNADGTLSLLYEDFSMTNLNKYGTINLAILDKNFDIILNEQILDTTLHTSYPFVFIENNIIYVIPETSIKNKVSVYEFDIFNKCLINEKVLIDNVPILDSTILFYDDKYWLFGTISRDGDDHSKLYIYYSESLFGPYLPHKKNPVKNNLNGSRPAGSIINFEGNFYRPAQNCKFFYGESIDINKILLLNEYEFSEELIFKFKARKNSKFNSGTHTINFQGNVMVMDGIKFKFKPLLKLKLFFKKLNERGNDNL